MDSTRARLAALPDDELERRLFDLAGHISWPQTPDVKPVTGQQRPIAVRRFERRYLWLAAAIVLFSLGAALALSQGFRDTVAGVFGVRGVDIVILREDELTATPDITQPASNLAVGRVVSMDEAIESLPFQPLLPAVLDETDALYIRTLPGGAQMFSAAYAPQQDLPEAAETGVGLLLMQFTSEVDAPMLVKGVAADASIFAEVDIDGVIGYWIEGASQLTILSDPSAAWDEPATRPSANVLLWQADGVTFRMESALSQIEALEIAQSMQAIEDQ